MSETLALQSWLEPMGLQPRLPVLLALLLLGAGLDLRKRRIPNLLTVGGAVIGLAMGLWAVPPLGGAASLAGLALGLALMLPFYATGVMGAGDVKLMAMAGSFLGPGSTLQAVLFVWLTGGLLALGWALMHGAWGPLWANLRALGRAGPVQAASVGKLPYGLSICLGTSASVLAHPLGYL